MLMYIHSYLSKHEVIGLLGGRHYESTYPYKGDKKDGEQTVKFIIISKIYISESCTHDPR